MAGRKKRRKPHRGAVPRTIFPAACPACGKAAKFMEFRAEPCTPREGERAEYAFRCLACAARFPELTDADGRLHRWVEGRHVEAAP